jgi:hypothetical protein
MLIGGSPHGSLTTEVILTSHYVGAKRASHRNSRLDIHWRRYTVKSVVHTVNSCIASCARSGKDVSYSLFLEQVQ